MSNELRTYNEAIDGAVNAFKDHDYFERESGFALQVVNGNTALQKPGMLPSLRNAVENIARIGITLNPAMKLAYLVPRGGIACLDISYMGLIKIATDSGSVKSVVSRVVYASDQFEVVQGTVEKIIHRPDPWVDKKDADIKGVYCVATLKDGGSIHEVMSRSQIDDVAGRSKASTGPWKTDYPEMARKTVVKRASKYWPKTQLLDETIHVMNQGEGYNEIASRSSDVVEQTDTDNLNDKRREVTAHLKKRAAEEEMCMRDYAESVKISSIKAMTLKECNDYLGRVSALEGEVVKEE